MSNLHGKKIAFLATDGFEQSELEKPWKELGGAGADTHIISLEEGHIRGFNHTEKADNFTVDFAIGSVRPDQYDAIVLPGGLHNPDSLRTNEKAIDFVRHFLQQDKTIAAICHGPWTLIETGLLKGRRLTSFPSIKTDLKNAGAEWVDEEVAVDKNLVTSRNPDDIPAFNKAIIDQLSEKARKSA